MAHSSKEKSQAYFKKYRLENKEKLKAYFKGYRFKNKERLTALHKEYRIKNREKDKSNREKFAFVLNTLKSERGCYDCGYNSDPAFLQFDHARGIKRKSVYQMFRYNWDEVQKENEKCDVRCIKCHQAMTKKRMEQKYG